MRIYNNDGSEAQACGNGTRCVADYLFRELRRDAFTVDTRAADILCERIGASAYRVDMGPPSLGWADIPTRDEIADTSRVAIAIDGAEGAELREAALVSMGNPHAVFFVADLDKIDVGAAGPKFETHPMFPEKANISFAEVTGARLHPPASLGARRRGNARVRLGGLRDACLRRPPQSDRSARAHQPARRRCWRSNGGARTAMSCCPGRWPTNSPPSSPRAWRRGVRVKASRRQAPSRTS